MNCMLSAFSKAMKVDPHILEATLGHDGMDKVNDLDPPKCNRGFHYQEFCAAGLLLGYAVIPFARKTYLGEHSNTTIIEILAPDYLVRCEYDRVVINGLHAEHYPPKREIVTDWSWIFVVRRIQNEK